MKGLLFLLSFQHFAFALTFELLAPFYPAQVLRHHITPLFNGVVIGINGLSQGIGAFCINARLMKRFGRFKTALMGSVLTGLSMLGFAFTDMVESDGLFIFLSVFLRFAQGLGISLAYEATFAMANSLYPQNIAFANASLFCGLALGFALSPALGAALYAPFGFEAPFLAAAALNASILLYSFCFHGEGEDHSTELSEVTGQRLLQTGPTVPREPMPTIWDFLVNTRALFAALNFFFVGSAYVFFEPILANELVQFYGLEESISALLFFIFLGLFGLGGIVLLIIPERVERRKLMIGMGLVAGVGCYLMGPGAPFPRDLFLIEIALGIAGLSSAMSMNSSSGQSLKAMKSIFPEHYERLADLNAKIINIMSSGNNLINPLIAAALADTLDYRTTCAIYGGIIFFFSLLYWFAHVALIPQQKLKGSNQLNS